MPLSVELVQYFYLAVKSFHLEFWLPVHPFYGILFHVHDLRDAEFLNLDLELLLKVLISDCFSSLAWF